MAVTIFKTFNELTSITGRISKCTFKVCIGGIGNIPKNKHDFGLFYRVRNNLTDIKVKRYITNQLLINRLDFMEVKRTEIYHKKYSKYKDVIITLNYPNMQSLP